MGEMERDCLIAHGAASFLKEKFVELSDGFFSYIAKDTGLMAIGDVSNQTIREDQTSIRRVHWPWCFKLLSQELASIGIAMRLVV
jgi:DNA-directed RNA polymerase II subunit RPB2